MSQFNRFTIKAQEALQGAQDLAAQKNHGEFRVLHLLLTLVTDDQSLVRPMLTKSGVNVDALHREVETELDKLPRILGNSSVGQLYLSQEVMQVIDRAGKIALNQKDEYISCEHLLLAVLDVPSSAQRILEKFSLRRDLALRTLTQLRGATWATAQSPRSQIQVFAKKG